MYVSDLKEPSPAGLRRARRLQSPCGLVSRSFRLPNGETEPPFAIYTAALDNPSAVLSTQRNWSHSNAQGNFDGAGGAIDPVRARDISIVESLERYSSCTWDEAALIMATQAELGDAAVGPDRFPRCSERELAADTATLVEYDPRLPIRWQRAWSLTRGREVFVPANLVYLRFPVHSQAELFTHPISTGTAAHSDIHEAVLGGLLEVVERDSISLTWLQRLHLPSIEVDEALLRPATREYHCMGTSSDIKVRLFNATTDYGIPVIYGIQLSQDPVLAQVVAATCDLDPERALAKIHREFSSLRIALRAHAASPDPFAMLGISVVGGAVLHAQASHRGVFDFLLEGSRPTVPLHEIGQTPDPQEDPLSWAVDRLAQRGAEVIAVDITTDEARQVGMHVVKVLVPEAMPLSFVHSARYLATPRLYAAPAAMGLEVHGEEDINPDFQPFA
ncbi:YcaO-like family protein [Actinomyces qiguomingii]|uniref:YcaO-like family protein n=1 Tax=Actinomyces qiguomingii TaxID=2057800 RepID=UPI000CA00C04|nr:YcaO-like family protein [Actinomyces qiguomingii]